MLFRRPTILVAMLVSTLQNAFGSTSLTQQAAPRSADQLTFSAFVGRLNHDPALRTRFAKNPSAALREVGLDPDVYDLPDRLDKAQVGGLVDRWMRLAAQAQQPVPDRRLDGSARGSADKGVKTDKGAPNGGAVVPDDKNTRPPAASSPSRLPMPVYGPPPARR